MVLRPSQVAALMKDSQPPSDNGTIGTTYPLGALIGVGLGIGLPLLFALIITLLVLRKEKQKTDLMEIFEKHVKSVETVEQPPMNSNTIQSKPSFSTLSRTGTTTTISSLAKPQMPAYFMERYGYSQSQERDLGVPVYELASTPPYSETDRAEAP